MRLEEIVVLKSIVKIQISRFPDVIRDREIYLPGANPKESLFNQHKLSDKRKVFQVLMKWSVQM